jgi:hypothetical protein
VFFDASFFNNEGEAVMKKVLLLSLAILCCAGLVFAQPPGSVAVYADSAGTTCQLYDEASVDYQEMWFHFIHVADVGATAVEFQFVPDADLIWGTDLGDVCPWILKLGTFKTGMSISYGSCLTAVSGYGIYLGKTGLKHGKSVQNDCAYAYVKNHPIPGIPGSTTPLASSCGGTWLVLRGSFIIVSNSFDSCPCPGRVPNEESSWGKIKALYE